MDSFCTLIIVVILGFGYSETHSNVDEQISDVAVLNSCNGVPQKVDVNSTISIVFDESSYIKNQDCEWIINADKNMILEYSLYDVNIENSQHCSKDYIRISHPNDKIGNTFCGHTKLIRNTISDNQMTVKLKTGMQTTSNGFTLNIVATSTIDPRIDGCRDRRSYHQLKSGETVNITMDQNAYLNAMKCQWTFEAPPGLIIQYELLRVNIEKNDLDCSADHLTFYKGRKVDQSKVVGEGVRDQKICGYIYHLYPQTIQSNIVTSTFVTDSSWTTNGFIMLIRPVPNHYTTDIATTTPRHSNAGCNNITQYIDTVDVATLQINRNDYDNGMYCRWTIRVPHHMEIDYQSSNISIEGDSSFCGLYDRLELFVGDGDYFIHKIGKDICGEHQAVSGHIRWRSMTLIFHTDNFSAHFNGFQFTFKATTALPLPSIPPMPALFPGCKTRRLGRDSPWIYLDIKDEIPVDLNADHYLNRMQCRWYFRVPADMEIQVTMRDANLDSACWDSVHIYHGYSMYKSDLVKRYCYNTTLDQIHVRGNRITVTFETNRKDTFNGFKLNIKAVDKLAPLTTVKVKSTTAVTNPPSDSRLPGCRGQPFHHKSNSTFSFSLSGNAYQKRMDCIWVLTFPKHTYIKYEFSDMATEYRDFIYIYKGDSVDSSGQVGKSINGKQSYIRNKIRSNIMTIRFKTMSYTIGSGFKFSCKAHFY